MAKIQKAVSVMSEAGLDVIIKPRLTSCVSDTRVSVTYVTQRTADDLVRDFEQGGAQYFESNQIEVVTITERKRITLRSTITN